MSFIPFQIDASGNKIPYFFQPPPFIATYYKHQTVNADSKLQEIMTNYFLDKTIDWIRDERSFSNTKRQLARLKDHDKGFNIIKHILKIYIKRTNGNWFDLKRESHQVKRFINEKLSD
jgi:hypothetical protein